MLFIYHMGSYEVIFHLDYFFRVISCGILNSNGAMLIIYTIVLTTFSQNGPTFQSKSIGSLPFHKLYYSSYMQSQFVEEYIPLFYLTILFSSQKSLNYVLSYSPLLFDLKHLIYTPTWFSTSSFHFLKFENTYGFTICSRFTPFYYDH